MRGIEVRMLEIFSKHCQAINVLFCSRAIDLTSRGRKQTVPDSRGQTDCRCQHFLLSFSFKSDARTNLQHIQPPQE